MGKPTYEQLARIREAVYFMNWSWVKFLLEDGELKNFFESGELSNGDNVNGLIEMFTKWAWLREPGETAIEQIQRKRRIDGS